MDATLHECATRNGDQEEHVLLTHEADVNAALDRSRTSFSAMLDLPGEDVNLLVSASSGRFLVTAFIETGARRLRTRSIGSSGVWYNA